MTEIKLVQDNRAPEPRTTITATVSAASMEVINRLGDGRVWTLDQLLDKALRDFGRKYFSASEHQDGGMVDHGTR